MKVALVYDRINKWGGAERVLLALHDLWPDAPLYTAVYDARRASWANGFMVKPSFIQYIPFAKNHHEWFPWLTPLAFESFNFDAYDVVISVTSAEAKYVITKPETLHVCYCLTPTRYLWSGEETYIRSPGLGGLVEPLARHVFPAMLPTLKRWDRIASSRPDYYVAISERVKARIEKYYQRHVEAVIYPPVDDEKFRQKAVNRKQNVEKENYFLVVSRFVSYKRIDLIIDAFNELKLPLVIIGSGHEEKLLRAHASDTISFVTSHLTDAELSAYYGSCRAFLSAADEDFGIAAVEAQSAGRPVIAFAQSGIGEIVRDGETGILFDEQSKQGIVDAVGRFLRTSLGRQTCVENAHRFRKKLFMQGMKTTVESLYRHYKTI